MSKKYSDKKVRKILISELKLKGFRWSETPDRVVVVMNHYESAVRVNLWKDHAFICLEGVTSCVIAYREHQSINRILLMVDRDGVLSKHVKRITPWEYAMREIEAGAICSHQTAVELDNLVTPDSEQVAVLSDPINPSHYKLGLPCESIEYQLAVCNRYNGNQAPMVFNVLKYVTRAPLKNKLEDLKKARWYLNKLVEIYDN